MAYVAIAGLAVSAGTAIYGGVKAGKERKKMDSYLNKQNSENESLFNKDYYGNYTDRSDVQYLQKQLRDNLREKTRRTEQMSAITGATPEAMLAEKEQNNKVMSDTTANIAAQGQQYKDRVMDRYLNMKSNIGNQQYGSMAGNAASYENVMGNGIRGVGSGLQGMATNALATKTNGVQIPKTDNNLMDSTIKTDPNLTGTPEINVNAV